MKDARVVITGRDDHGRERVRELLDGLAHACAVSGSAVADMQVALDEILSNILRHGYADGLPHRIEVTLSVQPHLLTTQIEDDCAAFDPLAMAPPEPRVSLASPKPGGLGIYFVRSLMSEVNYVRDGAHNRLVLKRQIAQAAPPGR